MDIVKLVCRILENTIIQQKRPYQEMFAISVQFKADKTSANKN